MLLTTMQLRKAEAIVENDAMWRGQEQAQRRQRMRAITFNNLGCLLKRRNQPQLALQVWCACADLCACGLCWRKGCAG
jgi:hypothetical protein